MERLKNKIAVVTGAAGGIGRATVKRFLEEGAVVSAWDLNEQAGKMLLEEFADQEDRLEFVVVNVAASDEVRRVVDTLRKKYGRIDILINNAGITRDATLLKMDETQWDAVIDVNLKGVFNCGQTVAAVMVEQGSGVIVNTASVVAMYGNFGQSNYVASKAGVIGLTKTWARELGRMGIRVNAVAPGFIKTEMVATVPEKVITILTEKTPLQRMGRPADIADAFVYLSSDEADFVTGTVLSVDGGLVL